jgi:hypothetical protein
MAVKKLHVTGGSIIPQSDWLQNDETQADYIKNKPKTLELTNAPDSTTVGVIGQMCINTTENTVFVCTDISDIGTYVWQKIPTKFSDLEEGMATDEEVLQLLIDSGVSMPLSDASGDIYVDHEQNIITI